MNNVQIFVSQQIQHELQQGAKQMPNTNPFETPVSKNEFNGYWIPSHNAKVMKKGLEENSAPFLPDTSGNIKAEAVYSLSTGKCLPANRLIPVQFEKMKMGYESNIVVSKSTISEMNTEGKGRQFPHGCVLLPRADRNPRSLQRACTGKNPSARQPQGHLHDD